MSPPHLLLLASLGLLIASKLADLLTTLRHVGPEAESNPLARSLFRRVGFRVGLVAVMGIWCLIVVVVFVSAWGAPLPIQVLTAFTGIAVAWVQWDVARFNSTARHSGLTRLALRLYGKWSRWR